MVWQEIHRPNMSGKKMKPRFDGPFTLTDPKANGSSFALINSQGERLHGRVNVNQLKRYKSRKRLRDVLDGMESIKDPIWEIDIGTARRTTATPRDAETEDMNRNSASDK